MRWLKLSEGQGEESVVGKLSELDKIRYDVARYFAEEQTRALHQKVWLILRRQEIWAILLYRIGSYIHVSFPRPLSLLLKVIWIPLNGFVSMLLDTHISRGAQIGPGLYIGHYGGIWISPRAKLGADCNISQGVVIGRAAVEKGPTLGDRVWLGPHAVVTGPVVVGHDCVIGANSLVARDIPNKAVVVGVPARILSHAGSSKLIKVPGDEYSPDAASEFRTGT